MNCDGGRASRIVLGTMRLHERGRTEQHWVDLLGRSFDRGIRWLHSSCEYESYPFLRAVLARLRVERPEVSFGHVVKLADPSFDDAGLEADRIRAAVNAYRQQLGADTVGTVQWMWRKDLKQEERRLAGFEASFDPLRQVATELKVAGAIGEFACFPYTGSFASAAVRSGLFDGLLVYRNVEECEFADHIAEAAERGMHVDIIRPFAAGKAFCDAGTSAAAILDDLLAEPGVRRAILSISSAGQLDELLA